uniref:Uncharacterized protein n=1 Tax=Onchocerca volvulus TaxID=6282 RepID=A0A8R1XVC8_ONCVO
MSHFARSVRSAAGWLVDICAGRESIHHNSKVELWVDVAAAAAEFADCLPVIAVNRNSIEPYFPIPVNETVDI